MKPAVRQMRGPGMNLGLKKPRKKMAEPKDYPKPKLLKASAGTSSYLPDLGPDGKPRRKRG